MIKNPWSISTKYCFVGEEVSKTFREESKIGLWKPWNARFKLTLCVDTTNMFYKNCWKTTTQCLFDVGFFLKRMELHSVLAYFSFEKKFLTGMIVKIQTSVLIWTWRKTTFNIILLKTKVWVEKSWDPYLQLTLQNTEKIPILFKNYCVWPSRDSAPDLLFREPVSLYHWGDASSLTSQNTQESEAETAVLSEWFPPLFQTMARCSKRSMMVLNSETLTLLGLVFHLFMMEWRANSENHKNRFR